MLIDRWVASSPLRESIFTRNILDSFFRRGANRMAELFAIIDNTYLRMFTYNYREVERDAFNACTT
jgi:hypothetical protein